MALDLEGSIVEKLQVPHPENCRCRQSLRANPPVFAEAFSGFRELGGL